MDSSYALEIMSLKFNDSYLDLTLDTNTFLRLPLTQQEILLTEIENELGWIERQGFLATLDLTNYPIISKLLPSFIQRSGVENLEYICGDKSMECYK